jgi:hypothetical protein
MTVLMTSVLCCAAVFAMRAPAAQGQATLSVETGWLGLFTQDLVEWLENANQLERLCTGFPTDSADWSKCRAQKLAPKIFVVPLWAGPSEKAAAAGLLLVTAVPGEGLRSWFVSSEGGTATEFQPDLFDRDWGYGPYFHQTFVERRGAWFRLAEEPFLKGTWINAARLGDQPNLQLLESEQIVSSPFGDLFVLGIERDVLRARPEQEADMWCKAGNPPPLAPWRELRIPIRDLYTPNGHLVVHKKYIRGC